VIIARAIDQLMEQVPAAPAPDPWGTWAAPEPRPKENRVTVKQQDDASEVIIPPVSEHKQELRRKFEQSVLKLESVLGDGADWTEAYARGGPLWLYHANRDLVMSYPRSTRAAMVADVEEESPEDAQLMSIDVLKYPGETGPGGTGMHVAEGNIG
jgi:hypothetical protein